MAFDSSLQQGRLKDLTTFGVIIGCVDKMQNHIGFLYRKSDGNLFLLDLQWHRIFRHLPAQTGLYPQNLQWVRPRMSLFNQEMVQDWFEIFGASTSADALPYGIWFAGEFATPDGTFIQPIDEGIGLTCATFVMQLLKSKGFEVIDSTDWPIDRPSDAAWQERILNTLMIGADRNPAFRDDILRHVNSQRDFVGKVPRFRPEEVAGAFSIFELESHSFVEVEPAAAWIARTVAETS